jgi:exosortase
MNSNRYQRLLRDSRFLRFAVLLLALGLVGIVFYSSTLSELLSAVLRREESSHGLFVPLLSLLFVWRKRNRLREIEPRDEIIPGVGVLAVGLLLFSLARAYNYFFWESCSFLIVLAGLVICFLGKDWFKEIIFPIFFLICMIPIPWNIYLLIANWVKSIALELSTDVLALTGVPFLREESLLHLPNVTLNVTPGCSGIRYLLSYFVFGLAYAYLYRNRVIQRCMIVLLSIPISLMASTLRVTGLALLAYYIGPQAAETFSWQHTGMSWLLFLSVLAFFLTLDQWLVSGRAISLTETTQSGGSLA